MTGNSGRKAAQRATRGLLSCARCGGEKTLQTHHKDRNPLNNSPENLEKLCQACHTEDHHRDGTWGRGKVALATCAVCGRVFQPKRSRRAKVCGQHCLSEMGRISAKKRWAGSRSA